MNLKKAKKLKVGDTVSTSYPIGVGIIEAVTPDPDPRVTLLFDIDYKGRTTHNINYLHIKAKL